MEQKNKKVVKKIVKKEKPEHVQKPWILVDAKGKILGRMASQISTILRGKDKVSYLPYKDNGSYVVVINATKVAVTGRKEDEKDYYRYSGYPGGLKIANLKKLREEKPEEIIRHAVYGMMPKTRLGNQMMKKLYIYSGEKHPHEAQKVESIEV